jgi:hypothetical protein
MNHPLGLKWELYELDLQLSPSDTKVYLEKALVNLKRARDRVARRYNDLRSDAVFRVGDLVLVKLHPQSSKVLKRSAKFENKWSNPLIIVKLLTKLLCNLRTLILGLQSERLMSLN